MKKTLSNKIRALIVMLIPVLSCAFNFSIVSGTTSQEVWISNGKIDGQSFYLATQDVRLMPAGATFYGQIQIGAKNITVDGNHCTLDGSTFHQSTSPISGMVWNSFTFTNSATTYYKYCGIVAKPTNGVNLPSVDISGTTIKNLIVKNWSNHGIYLRRCREQDAADFDGDGNLTEEIPEEAYFNGSSRGLLYEFAPRSIRLLNMLIQANGRTTNPADGTAFVTGNGVFVPAYSEYCFMQNLEVYSNGSVGIYLERESRFANIINCEIHHNWREGIAVDSSAHNMIFHNELYYNNWIQDFTTRAGIKLYKNAGESNVKRYQHSSFNQIFHNIIHHERTGVWVASRQASQNAESRWNFDASALGEETFPYDGDDGTMMDYARHNMICYNSFSNNAHAHIKVEDDFTIIVKNSFGNVTGASHTCDLNLGNEFRNERGRAISGTTIVGNIWSTGASQMLLYDASTRETLIDLYSNDGLTDADDAALDRKGIYADWGYDGKGYLPSIRM